MIGTKLIIAKNKMESKKQYEFVRFKYIGHPDKGEKHWWFVVRTYDDVVEHTKKFFQPTMQEGFDAYAANTLNSLRKDISTLIQIMYMYLTQTIIPKVQLEQSGLQRIILRLQIPNL